MAGYAAHLRAQAVVQMGHERIRIRGVHDKNPKNCSQFAGELGVPPYASLEKICSDESINAISVAVPNRYHYEIVKCALDHGRNAICEYPLVIQDFEQALELVALAEERGVLLHVGQTMNYDDDLGLVLQHRNELGRLYMGYKYMSFGGASSMVQWGMPIQGKWFNTLIVSGSKGTLQVDNGSYDYQTDTVRDQGILEETNTFIEDFHEILREIDGVSDVRPHTDDMLQNLKIALYAERSAEEHAAIEIE
jgi:hypothetical protein